jgi:hypothetical protein
MQGFELGIAQSQPRKSKLRVGGPNVFQRDPKNRGEQKKQASVFFADPSYQITK